MSSATGSSLISVGIDVSVGAVVVARLDCDCGVLLAVRAATVDAVADIAGSEIVTGAAMFDGTALVKLVITLS